MKPLFLAVDRQYFSVASHGLSSVLRERGGRECVLASLLLLIRTSILLD